jgi:LysR family transcriptional regulator, transcriptional activator for dmlA
MHNLPRPEDLSVFCAVARLSNFKNAAKELGMSPAFISKRIRLLEDQLHVKLFHRTTRNVTLTDEGDRLVALSVQILDKLDQLVAETGSASQSLRGRLRICSSMGFGRIHVGPIIAQLVIRHPELQVRFEVLDRVVDPGAEGFDLDIRIGDEIASHLIARKLVENKRIILASPDYLKKHGIPERLSDLSMHRCIAIKERDHPVGVWRLHRKGKEETVNVNDALSTSNGEVAVDWALAGLGILLRSVWDIYEDLSSGRLVQILPEYSQPANIWAVYPPELRDTRKITTVVAFFRESLAPLRESTSAHFN